MDNQTTTIIASVWKAITSAVVILGVAVSLGDISILILGLVTGLATMAIASYKGRKDMLWSFLYGVAWGAFAVLYYLISPKEGVKVIPTAREIEEAVEENKG